MYCTCASTHAWVGGWVGGWTFGQAGFLFRQGGHNESQSSLLSPASKGSEAHAHGGSPRVQHSLHCDALGVLCLLCTPPPPHRHFTHTVNADSVWLEGLLAWLHGPPRKRSQHKVCIRKIPGLQITRHTQHDEAHAEGGICMATLLQKADDGRAVLCNGHVHSPGRSICCKRCFCCAAGALRICPGRGPDIAG